MPKTPIDWSKTIIYKLCCNDLNITDIYIGMTTNFKQRKRQHKNRCNNLNNEKSNYKIYKFIRENGGWENWSMIMLEECKCDNELQARAKEREWYEKLYATLNVDYPNRTQKEYQEEKMTCECGCIIRKDNLRNHLKTIKHQEHINKKNNIIIN